MKRSHSKDEEGNTVVIRDTTDDGRRSTTFEYDRGHLFDPRGKTVDVTDHHKDGPSTSYEHDSGYAFDPRYNISERPEGSLVRTSKTVTLQLSSEQQQRLAEGAARQDSEAVRETLHQAVGSAIESILESRGQPRPEARQNLLDELETEFADLPGLSDEAVSRAEIYRDHL